MADIQHIKWKNRRKLWLDTWPAMSDNCSRSTGQRSRSSKVADFDPPHLYLAPPYGVTPVEFRGDLWHQKARVPGLSCGVVCVIVCLAVLVELRLVTDTDRQTDTDPGPWLVPQMHSIARLKPRRRIFNTMYVLHVKQKTRLTECRLQTTN